MSKKELIEKTIVIGLRNDQSLYFEMSPDILPHEALGMASWFQSAIQSNVETQQGIGAGGASEIMKVAISELRSLHETITNSHQKVLKALDLMLNGVMTVSKFFGKAVSEVKETEKNK